MIERYWRHPLFVPAAFAAVKLLLHLYVNAFAGYGYFRDELYYIVSTDHLSAGYVDHPPLSIWILALSRMLIGDSLFAVRLIPALAGAATVFMTGVMTIELGGNRFAQSLACIAVIVSPIFLAMNTFYSMNAIDILLWSIALFLFLRIVRASASEDDEGPSLRQWSFLGVILGLGLLNKVGVLWLGFGIGAALILTPLRRYLRTPGPWVAGAIAFAFFVPYVMWNAQHEWAHLVFIRNASAGKYAGLSAVDFITGQFLIHNPGSSPLWIAGLFFFFLKPVKEWRAPGILFAAAFLVLVLNGTSKPEYLAPAFPLLFAAGGVQCEMITSRVGRVLFQRIFPVTLTLGILLAPITLPILSVESYISFARSIGMEPTTAESKELADLPQFYADMFGWPELADRVADVYEALPDSDRAACVIFGQNYGEASAVNFFGSERDLPRAISGHNSYYLWGPGDGEATTVIIVGGRREDHESLFESVDSAAIHTSRYAMPYENNLILYVCRGMKVPIGEVWSRVQNYS